MTGPGLFGKLPSLGDFFARGLTAAERRSLDQWVTAHLAPHKKNWPIGGVRGLIELGEQLVLFVAEPSRDHVGRQFPVVAVTDGAGRSLESAETWCDAAAAILRDATENAEDPEVTLAQLDAVEAPLDDDLDDVPALWVAGTNPMPCDADTLAEIFSSG